MMINVELPLNSLSFGNVSLNILKELFRRNEEICLFPIGEKADLNAFKLEENFKTWLSDNINNRWSKYDIKNPSLKLWHINGSDNRKSKIQNLYTFYECSEPTEIELSIVKNQDKVFFSSSYACETFKNKGLDNCYSIPVGFDPSFGKIEVPKPDGIQFLLMGKYEYRKRTEKIIRTWLKKYGNNTKYTLNLCVTNPFFKPEDMSKILNSAFEGKNYNNVNILPYLKTNEEVNMLMNVCDIDLSGLSGAEGWNLPAFNMTCLGKWSIVLNATSHKDWANSENSILVEPSKTIPAADGVFFHEKSQFNQGVFYDWEEEDMLNAIDIAVSKCLSENVNGAELSRKFSYENMVSLILSGLQRD